MSSLSSCVVVHAPETNVTGATSSSRPRCGRNRRLLAKAPPVDVAPSRARGETRHRPGTAACGAGHTDSETLGALWETHVTSSRALFSAATIAVLTSLHLNCHSPGPGPHVHGHEEPDAAHASESALHMDSAEGHTSKFSSTRFLTSQGGGYIRAGALPQLHSSSRVLRFAHIAARWRIYIHIGVPDVLHNSRPAARHNWRVLGVAAAGRVRELREPRGAALRTQRKPRPG